MSRALKPALVIMGPTASGKTALSVAAARRFNGEVISADSMQVYRGLDIGSAKPSSDEQQGVPHHLIDILEPSRPLDVFTFVRLAEESMAAISGKGCLPVISGGTGFYLHALIYGLDPMPADPALRRNLDLRYDHEDGFAELKEYMRRHDPEDLARWQKNRRKLIRACEVFTLTGKSITQLQTLHRPEPRFPLTAIRLEWSGEELRNRIADRTRQMLANGWLEEAERMLRNGLMETPTARQAIGYRHIGDYLSGQCDMATMTGRIITSTWQFARRQQTWFRRQHPEAEPIAMPQTEESLLELIARRMEGK